MQVALPGCLLVLKLAARAGCGYNGIEVWVVNYLYMISSRRLAINGGG